MSKAPLCKVCRERPAAVPDRNKPSFRWRREICRECHAGRLQDDLAEVLTANMVAHKLRDEALSRLQSAKITPRKEEP